MRSNFLYRFGIIAGFMGFLSGCTFVTLQPGAERVHVTSTPIAKNCLLVGTISSENISAASSHAYMQSNEIKDLKNQALKLGANMVVLTQHDFRDFTVPHMNNAQITTKHLMVGNAYRCPQAK
jgi:hypothetical protein